MLGRQISSGLSGRPIICSATAMQAQAPPPNPDPEVKKLHVYVGHWSYEGEAMPGPLGPGGKFTGEQDAE